MSAPSHEALNRQWAEHAARDLDDPNRCAYRVKPTPLPPSFPVESARRSAAYRHCLEPGARCALDVDHEGPHRNGGLIWHDPPALFVGGERIW